MPTIEQHFSNRSPVVKQIYDRIVAAAGGARHVRVEPKKTSIHLCRESAFAGIATRKDALVLTLKSEADIKSPRIHKREQASAHRWHLEIRLDDPKQVDAELTEWLARSVDLSKPRGADI